MTRNFNITYFRDAMLKPQSAKAKGRKFQQWVKSTILAHFLHLTDKDVRSTSMGAGGADILLSEFASKIFPYAIECKHRKSFNIYTIYDQAAEHRDGDEQPLVFIKANNKPPLAIVDAEWFVKLHDKIHGLSDGLNKKL